MPQDEDIRALMRNALDHALMAHIGKLYASWLADAKGQPARAANGVRKAVAAYRHAVVAIENEKLD